MREREGVVDADFFATCNSVAFEMKSFHVKIFRTCAMFHEEGAYLMRVNSVVTDFVTSCF